MSKRSLFVWECVSGLTNNYHDGGGIVVIAASLDVARSLLKNTPFVRDTCEAFIEAPSYSAPVDADGDKVFVFPDAGCC